MRSMTLKAELIKIELTRRSGAQMSFKRMKKIITSKFKKKCYLPHRVRAKEKRSRLVDVRERCVSTCIRV